MSQEYLLFNDEFHPVDVPVLTTSNRGFKFGDGLFESMRMINHKLQFADLHADRLAAGMKALKIDGHVLMDDYFLRQKTADLVKKNRWNGNVRFRLSVYRQGAGVYTPESNKSGYVLEGIPLKATDYELNTKGLIIDVFDEMTKSINKLSNFKTSNALLYVMAGLFKTQNRLDEAIILNQSGFLCESISSNIFVVYDKQIYTPALNEGCISGVMRTTVMQICKMNDIPLIEAQISPEILKEAEEVFITNATQGIQWIMGYGRKRYFNEFSKYLNEKLNLL
ncbi:branched-chain amino acid aminotransferase [Pedobacter psychrotolerans]|uniref:branched-chain-amino-acid transaminase n=1 Tax=Pedobacter psychrotolerans TaxID=1843235 RepID=A0A4R2H4R2_9SPHI|nr:aminotransferase class IV [Pedobacter psychrotolerans]TCO20572.1 branched-chain amino acid aminotransferase [Pedobacter psychrotolerans]GGE66515.1 4-amino-4-deoxychorismate lyase [Pedobacter psychrotolerans]